MFEDIKSNFTFDSDPRPEDIKAVKKLAREAAVFRLCEIETVAELTSDSISGRDSSYRFIFARLPDGSLAGYVCYGLIPLTESCFDLYWIIVSPEYKGTGLASELLKKTEVAVRKAGGSQIFIETSSTPQFETARHFYLKSGYEVAARLADFYQKDDARTIYRKNL